MPSNKKPSDTDLEDDAAVQKRLLKHAKALGKQEKRDKKIGYKTLDAVRRTGNMFWGPEAMEKIKRGLRTEDHRRALEDLAAGRRKKPPARKPSPREMP